MNLCEKHWEELKQAIKDRGLYHLVAKSPEEATQNAVDSLEGKEPPFDPLMSASNMIFSHALDAVGFDVMRPEEGADKPPCPICHMLKVCSCGRGDGCDINNWIKYAADGALQYAREKQLVGGGQA